MERHVCLRSLECALDTWRACFLLVCRKKRELSSGVHQAVDIIKRNIQFPEKRTIISSQSTKLNLNVYMRFKVEAESWQCWAQTSLSPAVQWICQETPESLWDTINPVLTLVDLRIVHSICKKATQKLTHQNSHGHFEQRHFGDCKTNSPLEARCPSFKEVRANKMYDPKYTSILAGKVLWTDEM